MLFIFTLFPLLGSEELIKVTIQGEDKLFSKGVYFFNDLLGFVIIFVPIWVMVRLIVNKGWNEKQERERERA